MDTKELSKLFCEKFFVLVNEEYGYRYWFWMPPMKDKKELISWWANLETVDPFFGNPGESLPGKVIEADDCVLERFFQYLSDTEEVPYVFLHCDDDSFLRITQEEYHEHKGFERREE